MLLLIGYIAKISLKEVILSRFFLLFTQIISYVKLVFLQYCMADCMFTHGTIFGNWRQKYFHSAIKFVSKNPK